MYTIAQIEDAIISRLRAQLTYLRTCESLGDFLLSEAEDLTKLFPAVYVAYEGGEYNHEVSGMQDRRMTFSVIVMVKSLRGQEEARHGQGSEKGAYEVLDDVREALTDQTCGLEIDPLLPLDEAAVEGTKSLAIYGIRFRTRCRFTL